MLEESDSVTSVFFITHPEVVVDPHIPVPQWRLSPRGVARVHRMLEQAWVAEIGHIATSEERKAVDTAELLAGHLALSYVTRADQRPSSGVGQSSFPFTDPHRKRS
jgi:broad specificity phosphatase PhoE